MYQKHDSDKKILLFTHARSGSNSLVSILNLHSKINLAIEPFSKERHGWPENERKNLGETKTLDRLDCILRELEENYTGFKHLISQLPRELNECLLTERDFIVVFLQRQNFLKSVISKLIAEQTAIWTASDKKRSNKPQTLEPLNVEDVRQKVASLKNDLDNYITVISKSKTPLHRVYFEDLFTAPEEIKLDHLQSIFEFLGFEFPKDKEEEIRELVSSKQKITDLDFYRLVPNIQQIEDELGSDETGFLFR